MRLGEQRACSVLMRVGMDGNREAIVLLLVFATSKESNVKRYGRFWPCVCRLFQRLGLAFCLKDHLISRSSRL